MPGYAVSSSRAVCKTVVFGLGWCDSITWHQMPLWWNRYTRSFEVAIAEMLCRFKSCRGHQNMQKCCNGRQRWLRTSGLRVRISSSAPYSVGATADATSSNLVSLRVRISDGVPNAQMLELVYIKDLKSLAHARLRVRSPL